jgi:hypothetical protein
MDTVGSHHLEQQMVLPVAIGPKSMPDVRPYFSRSCTATMLYVPSIHTM